MDGSIGTGLQKYIEDLGRLQVGGDVLQIASVVAREADRVMRESSSPSIAM